MVELQVCFEHRSSRGLSNGSLVTARVHPSFFTFFQSEPLLPLDTVAVHSRCHGRILLRLLPDNTILEGLILISYWFSANHIFSMFESVQISQLHRPRSSLPDVHTRPAFIQTMLRTASGSMVDPLCWNTHDTCGKYISRNEYLEKQFSTDIAVQLRRLTLVSNACVVVVVHGQSCIATISSIKHGHDSLFDSDVAIVMPDTSFSLKIEVESINLAKLKDHHNGSVVSMDNKVETPMNLDVEGRAIACSLGSRLTYLNSSVRNNRKGNNETLSQLTLQSAWQNALEQPLALPPSIRSLRQSSEPADLVLAVALLGSRVAQSSTASSKRSRGLDTSLICPELLITYSSSSEAAHSQAIDMLQRSAPYLSYPLVPMSVVRVSATDLLIPYMSRADKFHDQSLTSLRNDFSECGHDNWSFLFQSQPVASHTTSPDQQDQVYPNLLNTSSTNNKKIVPSLLPVFNRWIELLRQAFAAANNNNQCSNTTTNLPNTLVGDAKELHNPEDEDSTSSVPEAISLQTQIPVCVIVIEDIHILMHPNKTVRLSTPTDMYQSESDDDDSDDEDNNSEARYAVYQEALSSLNHFITEVTRKSQIIASNQSTSLHLRSFPRICVVLTKASPGILPPPMLPMKHSGSTGITTTPPASLKWPKSLINCSLADQPPTFFTMEPSKFINHRLISSLATLYALSPLPFINSDPRSPLFAIRQGINDRLQKESEKTRSSSLANLVDRQNRVLSNHLESSGLLGTNGSLRDVLGAFVVARLMSQSPFISASLHALQVGTHQSPFSTISNRFNEPLLSGHYIYEVNQDIHQTIINGTVPSIGIYGIWKGGHASSLLNSLSSFAQPYPSSNNSSPAPNAEKTLQLEPTADDLSLLESRNFISLADVLVHIVSLYDLSSSIAHQTVGMSPDAVVRAITIAMGSAIQQFSAKHLIHHLDTRHNSLNDREQNVLQVPNNIPLISSGLNVHANDLVNAVTSLRQGSLSSKLGGAARGNSDVDRTWTSSTSNPGLLPTLNAFVTESQHATVMPNGKSESESLLPNLLGGTHGVCSLLSSTPMSTFITPWSKVAGYQDLKTRLGYLCAQWKNPDQCAALGVSPPGGLLLCGPSGVGKSLIAQELVAYAGMTYIKVGCADILQRYLGESEKKIRTLFAQAAANAPCILVIDDIHAIASNRSNARKSNRSRMNQGRKQHKIPFSSSSSSSSSQSSSGYVSQARRLAAANKTDISDRFGAARSRKMQSQHESSSFSRGNNTTRSMRLAQRRQQSSNHSQEVDEDDCNDDNFSAGDNNENNGDADGDDGNDDGTTGVGSRILSTLLNAMDGIEGRNGVYLVATTPSRGRIDAALLRPGRFDEIIDIRLPSPEDYTSLFQQYTRECRLHSDVTISSLASRAQTLQMTGADVKNVCAAAVLHRFNQAYRTSNSSQCNDSLTKETLPDDEDDDSWGDTSLESAHGVSPSSDYDSNTRFKIEADDFQSAFAIFAK